MLMINNQEFKYPTLCISVIDDYLVFTTKKNGSRYFEDLSIDKNWERTNTINLYLHNNFNFNNSESNHEILDYKVEISPNTLMDINLFLKFLEIQNLNQIFSEKVFEKYKFIFILRDPLDRFFTGFFEVVDSILGVLKYDARSLHTFGIIKKYFNIEDYNSLNNLTQDKINFILNEYTQSITLDIFNDEHLSLWNTFLLNFLQKENLLNKVKIIDLNDSEKLSIFDNLSQPSNKPWLSGWLNDESNKSYIEELLSKYKIVFDTEIESYKTLLNNGQFK
jgi:hypothetical protein